jgi:hypothetical protein
LHDRALNHDGRGVTLSTRKGKNPKHWIFKGIVARTQRGAPEKLRDPGEYAGKIGGTQ